MNLDDSRERAGVEHFLARAAGAQTVRIAHWTKLTGGAIQQNLRIDCEVAGGAYAGAQRWVLRTDAPSVLPSSRTRAEEFGILQIAYAQGVAVPRPWFLHHAAEGLPTFFIMEFCEGIAAAHVLTREGAVADPAGLLRDAGRHLARIHGMSAAVRELPFVGTPRDDPTRAYLLSARAYLDHWRKRFGESHPALEWGIHEWLRRAPEREHDVVFAHRDYRTGNLLVANGTVRAIFDWEFAAWGNPLEDLGWLCAPCWRFNGRHRVAGGIGDAADFLAGYNAERGADHSEQDLVPWEALGQIRWAIIALQQAERHLSGAECSLELALTGRLLPELEHDLLRLMERWERMTR